MSVHFDLTHLVSGDFECLEPADPAWLDQEEYWEDFNARFFNSNGRVYDTARDSNVKTWLTAPDRAPFSTMAEQLIDDLSGRVDLTDVDLVLLAHWMPDLHLGTSVTNFAQHKLGIDNGLGFAVSDRGPSAPLFAIDMAARYLEKGKRKALVMTMDQKHLLYRTPLVDELQPRNAGAILLLEADGAGGMQYGGYTRAANVPEAEVVGHIAQVCSDAGLDRKDVTVIAAPDVVSLVADGGPAAPYEMDRLCAGPFAALADMQAFADSVLLITYYNGELVTVLLQLASASEACA
ncbi:hypothetical protein CLV80_108127 [Yoonia maritima]|uniref:Uncharacterized protein n=1 Tax=Yoonia maritima TaxID=1435347 RepID=A0A2T0VXC1_9RHOB|nr:hypothetical protein [Yoonia maritima]PRY76663.1 hypothetical protein CLV80_108127 [Yoonia maritima]